MARIRQEELDRLKGEVSIKELAQRRGIELRKKGTEWFGLCPFHPEKTPSLAINAEKNLFHCLGCDAGGDVVAWVQKLEGVSFRHAVELLRADGAALTEDSESPVVKNSTVPKLPCPVELDVGERKLLDQVVDYYHQTLLESPEALEYLQRRGLRSSEMIERFRLGFANRTLGLRLPQRNRNAGRQLRTQLQKVGILRPSGHEHFNGSLVVPILDENGQVSEMYGRKIGQMLRKGTARHLYLPGPHRGVFNIAAFSASDELILCESLTDALSFWCAGFRNVTSSYGAAGFSAEHLEALKRYRIGKVFIAYDRDETGDRQADALAEKLLGEGIECLRVHFPQGMDANELVVQSSEPAAALQDRLRRAVWMGKSKPTVSVTVEPKPTPVSAIRAELDQGRPAESLARAPDEHKPAPSSTSEAEKSKLTESPAPEPDKGKPAASRAPAPDEAELATSSISEPEKSKLAASPAPKLDQGKPAASLAPSPEPPEPLFPLAAEAAGAAAPAPQPAAIPDAEPAATPAAPALMAALRPLDIPLEKKGEQIEIRLGDRFWRVRGLEKNTSFEQLKVNLLCARFDGFFVDNLDLYSARQRSAYIREASAELGSEPMVLKRDLGRVLLALEALHDEQLRSVLDPKPKRVVVPPERKKAALELLRDPKLLQRLLKDFERCGIVGEQTNKLVGYLGATSRKLDEPLAIIIQSSSAAGKSSLMDALLSFIPSEERVKFSAMTGQSLFYMGEEELQHKVLAIVEEEGAQRASYALKLLQSEGELSIASTGKDPHTGRLITQEYRVRGPVVIFMSTTNIEIDEELQNRCIVLTVDEEREQTRAIHRLQRHLQTLEGLWAKHDKKRLTQLHQDAQRLLRPVQVLNPYAHQLTFLDDRTRTRRDHMKYLTLILSIALLHQYQRPVKTTDREGQNKQYIEVVPEDIRVANELMHQVMGQSLDELPPQTRRMLEKVVAMVDERCAELEIQRRDYRFSRREVRRYSGWSDYQVKVHMRKLEDLEYVLVHRGRRGQSFVYELLYDGEGQDGSRFVMGLLEVDKLEHAHDKKREGSEEELEHAEADKEGPGRGQGGAKEGAGRAKKSPVDPPMERSEVDSGAEQPQKALFGGLESGQSYRPGGRNGRRPSPARSEVA